MMLGLSPGFDKPVAQFAKSYETAVAVTRGHADFHNLDRKAD